MRTLLRHQFQAMGTDCAVIVSTPTDAVAAAHRAVAAAVAEVAAQERALSRFDPESELMALNAACGRWFHAGERLFRAVSAAAAARRASGGRYDPTVLPALIAAGYDTTYHQLRPRNAGSIAGWRAGAAIELDPVRRRIRLAAGTSIDLGGIGKGHAASVALDVMLEHWPALPGALVDLGGDIAVTGAAPDGGAWRIAVADPRLDGRTLAVLALHSGAVATSGRDRRRLGPDRSGHHLIDPATGRPAVPGPLAVTVIAPGAGEAEAHATALAITPIDQAAGYLAAHPELAAIVIPAAGDPFILGRPPLIAGRGAWPEEAA